MDFYPKIISKYKIVSYYKLNKLLPANPLFHATSAAVSILARGEGLSSGKSSRFGSGNHNSISMSRDITWLLDGRFGKAILVLDRDELKTKFKIEPIDQLGNKEELEERVYTDKIPVKYIKAAIFLLKPYRLKSRNNVCEYQDPKMWPQSVKYIYFNPETKEIEEIN